MATNKVKMRLQGHEKFVLREGWINKALMIISNAPDVFTKKMQRTYLVWVIIWSNH